jgi:hypothetical protein
MNPLRTALAAQVFGGLFAFAVIELIRPQLWQAPLAAAAIQGACAALASHKLEAPAWWIPIHLGFLPLAVAATTLAVAPGWYLAAFLVLLLVFWRTDRSRVPLYLSNDATAAAVAAMLPSYPCHVADLGCGNGGFLRRLAKARPDCEFVGVEHAPLPWLWARLTAGRLPNCQVRYGDFWHTHLGLFDVVYAFLSPAPMPALWAKAREEMRAGARLVSNSFPVPEVPPAEVAEVADRRNTRLFCYRPAPQ